MLRARALPDGTHAVGHAGNLRNPRSADAFAMRSGTAPLLCSSGRNQHVRNNHRGGRQLNRLLHIMALVQSEGPASLTRAGLPCVSGLLELARDRVRCLRVKAARGG